MKIIYKTLILCSAFFAATSSYARCDRSTNSPLTTVNSAATPIELGNLTLSSPYLQPVGSILGHTVVATPTLSNATATTPLWTCDKADLANIYFLVATKGNEPWGGHIDIGGTDGLSDVYATWWSYIGVKQQMRDVVLTRYWKKLNIETYGERSNGKIDIRLMDIPPLEATLYRVSANVPSPPRTSACIAQQIAKGSYKSGYTTTGAGPYACNQPSAYIQLSGESSVTFGFARDQLGADSNVSINFLAAYNGFGYGFYNSGSTVSTTATCVARNATPVVDLGSVLAKDIPLSSMSPIRKNFNVEIECSNSAVSGISSNQVAIGFQPSAAANANAETLQLVYDNGAAGFLVSDNYFDSSYAKGVGIRLKNPDTNLQMRFLNQSPYTPNGTSGQTNGWYPVLEGNPTIIKQESGYTTYLKQYEASLSKLPNKAVTPGIIKATATVIVKVQ